jgi:hypothetical protein
MELDLGARALLNAGSGVLLVALAFFVGRLRPRRRGTAAFAVFSAAFGVRFISVNLLGLPFDPSLVDPVDAYGWALAAAMEVVVAASLVLVAVWVPVPMERGGRHALAAAAAASLAFAAVTTWATSAELPSFLIGRNAGNLALFIAYLLNTGMEAAFAFALLLLPLRCAQAPREGPALGRQFALLGTALALYPAVVAVGGLRQPEAVEHVKGAGLAVLLILVSGLWLRNAAAAKPPLGRAFRDAALAGPAAMLAATLLGVAAPGSLPAQAINGVARTLCVGLLAYAIVRHQVLGIDVKLKWTIRQSTVAAAFIGVFFVVSESASNFFAQSGLGPYLGIAAAGMLVFAMAPLQRAAERVASAAVPLPAGDNGAGSEGSSSARTDREDRFRVVVRRFLADGLPTREEERTLAFLAADLGIDAGRAFELREEAAAAGPRRPRGPIGGVGR